MGGLGGRAGGEQGLMDQGDSEIREIFGSTVTRVYGRRGAVTGTNENGEHLTGLASWKYIPRCEPGKGDSARYIGAQFAAVTGVAVDTRGLSAVPSSCWAPNSRREAGVGGWD